MQRTIRNVPYHLLLVAAFAVVASVALCLLVTQSAYAGTITTKTGGAKYYVETTSSGKNMTAEYAGPTNKKKTSYAIPKTIEVKYKGKTRTVKVNGIATGAFKGCKKVKTVNCKAAIRYIGSKAFYGCSKLTAFKSSAPIEEVYDRAFYGCSSLKTFKSRSGYLSYIGAAAFKNCKNLKSMPTLTGIQYKQNGKKAKYFYCGIGEGAFAGCKKMQSITIKSVGVDEDDGWGVQIASNAFRNCTALEKVVFQDVKKNAQMLVSDYAFYGCKKFSKIVNFDKFTSVRVDNLAYAKTPLSAMKNNRPANFCSFDKADFADVDGKVVYLPNGTWHQVFDDIDKDDPMFSRIPDFEYVDGLGWVNMGNL